MAESFRKTPEYNRRAAVIEGVRAGRTPNEIIKFFGYPRSTVYDIVQRYAASEESEEGSYESLGAELAIGQYRHVLVEGFLASE